MSDNYRVEKKYEFIIVIGVIFFGLLGVATFISEAVLLYWQVKEGAPFGEILFMLMLTVGYGIVFIIIAWKVFRWCLADYEIASDGLLIKSPLIKQYKLTWDEFIEVCIDYTSRTTRGEPAALKEILFVKKGEKLNFYGRWKSDNIFHFDRVISISYSDELYNWMKENCDVEIIDIRKPWEIDRYEAGWQARVQKWQKKK